MVAADSPSRCKRHFQSGTKKNKNLDSTWLHSHLDESRVLILFCQQLQNVFIRRQKVSVQQDPQNLKLLLHSRCWSSNQCIYYESACVCVCVLSFFHQQFCACQASAQRGKHELPGHDRGQRSALTAQRKAFWLSLNTLATSCQSLCVRGQKSHWRGAECDGHTERKGPDLPAWTSSPVSKLISGDILGFPSLSVEISCRREPSYSWLKNSPRAWRPNFGVKSVPALIVFGTLKHSVAWLISSLCAWLKYPLITICCPPPVCHFLSQQGRLGPSWTSGKLPSNPPFGKWILKKKGNLNCRNILLWSHSSLSFAVCCLQQIFWSWITFTQILEGCIRACSC